MALAYDANRVTRDVDATFVPHEVVLEEARNVAEALGRWGVVLADAATGAGRPRRLRGRWRGRSGRRRLGSSGTA
jgi:hypothetical protein